MSEHVCILVVFYEPHVENKLELELEIGFQVFFGTNFDWLTF